MNLFFPLLLILSFCLADQANCYRIFPICNNYG
ncbi:hypothetical protein GLYMA_11G139950v4 [Glycine max]|nr:hypothetical protein GLYMA_11G139950v4 [Glycine max]KAH1159092.1 hypothetical protein GYH30_031010 [Glycine max]